MVGYLNRKYYAAILGNQANEIKKIISTLHERYHDDIIIKTYDDTVDLFEAINLNKLQSHPFDLAYIESNRSAEKMILKETNPELKIFTYEAIKPPKLNTVFA